MPSATGEFLRQVAFFISYNGCLPGIDLYLKLTQGVQTGNTTRYNETRDSQNFFSLTC